MGLRKDYHDDSKYLLKFGTISASLQANEDRWDNLAAAIFIE